MQHQSPPDTPPDNSQCSMVGLLGILIQLGLGILSFSALVIKRYRQKPRRVWKIWIFDTSKQLISQVIAHFINLTISIALASEDSSSDQCLWYFMTNILDNTVGVFICIGCLKGIEWSLTKRRKFQYLSGNYYKKEKVTVQIEIMDLQKGQVKDSIVVQQKDHHGHLDTNNDENSTHTDQHKDSRVGSISHSNQQTQSISKYQINYKAWLVQLLIWISIVVIGKSFLFAFEFGLQSQLNSFSFLIMGWIQKFPVLELVVVIVIVPVVMNGFAFWIQDNVLMKKQQSSMEGANPLIEQKNDKRQQEDIL